MAAEAASASLEEGGGGERVELQVRHILGGGEGAREVDAVRRFSESSSVDSSDGEGQVEMVAVSLRSGDDTARSDASSDGDDMCAICLSSFKQPQTFECSHVFCAACVQSWKRSTVSARQLLCPLCRKPMLDIESIVQDAGRAIIAECGMWQCTEAVAKLREVLAVDPAHPQARYYLSYALETVGDREGAIAELRLALASEFIPDSLTAAASYNLGILLKEFGDYDGAGAAYDTAIRVDPTAWKPLYNKGILNNEMEDFDVAETCYRAALQLDDSHDAVWYNLANLLMMVRRDIEGAEAAYRRAIARNPNCAMAHCNLGVLLEDEKADHAGAEHEYRMAIAIDPNYARAYSNLGVLLDSVYKDYSAAEAHYRRAIAIDPNHALGHYNLGILLEHVTEDFTAAEEAFRAALKINERDADAWYNLAHLQLHRLKDVDAAIASARKTIELEPKDTSAPKLLKKALSRQRKCKAQQPVPEE